MPVKQLILTRKVQLSVDSSDPEFKKTTIEKLYGWQHMCFRSANYIMTHHFIQSQLKELIYIHDDVKLRLEDINKSAAGMLKTSRLNTTYRFLSNKFKGKLPSDIFGNLNTAVFKHYNQHSKDIWSGKMPLTCFKRDIAMPIKSRSIKDLKVTEDGRDFSFTLFKIPFRTYLGRDVFDKRRIFKEILDGSIKLHDSSIKLDKGRIYLLLSYGFQQVTGILDPNVIAEATLSMEYPIAVKIGRYKYNIGNKEEFLHRRLAIQNAKRRMQTSAGYNRSGKGRKRKLKPLINYGDAEKRYVDYKLHVYSKRLVDVSLKHHAATIMLTEQTDKEEVAKQDKFLLRNWSYCNLKHKIEYKAEKFGIRVVIE